jgi:hypothetical protein
LSKAEVYHYIKAHIEGPTRWATIRKENTNMTMRLRAGLLILAFLLVAAFLSAGGKKEDQSADDKDTGTEVVEGFQSVTAANMQLQWKVDGDSLNVIVSAPTTGWVSVGFNPSRMMKDANIITGYVKDGQAFVRDDFGTKATGHAADESIGGRDDISEASGSEANGSTQIRFTIPLDSGDSKDQVLEAGQEYKVILAYGKNGADDYSSYHAKRGSARIKL